MGNTITGGTPATTEETSPTYLAYQAAGGATVPFADWPRVYADAERLLTDVTMHRDLTATGNYAGYAEQIADAGFRIADALYLGETGIISEKLGSYSYTLASPRTRSEARVVALDALSGTGATYRGLADGYSDVDSVAL